ncbi:methyltransferase domain-containing protein [Undibacterium cyanobacteriorum]|uniref:Methyltransferase domain-containing protein n=1 Tax=Undibacterium cyanobacteriorum TaxID=3073561 RepID=A0ABY9RPY2_9BURK|nr:methyltransferase domain-containing protein [Undibacterium sp. 20NA77.5]WMW82315.1 methyltransferase domain-containing protein [Undibacterium sp. 20NA77.5]
MKISVSLKALLLQLLTLAVGIVSLSLLHRAFGFTISPLIFLLACGAVAALFTFLLKFDWWWVPIQLLFFPLVYLTSMLGLPSWVYFVVAMIFSLLFWSTYRTQVPYYPSSKRLIPPIVELMNEFDSPRLIDVGSGFGGLLFDLSECVPNAQLLGVEIAPLPYWISVLRGKLSRSNVKFVFGAYEALNFAEFDVVFCYLSPVAMPFVWRKVLAEMRPGTILLSYEFIVLEAAPSFVLEIVKDAPPLYGWRI